MLKKIVILLLVSVMLASASYARTTEGVEMPEIIEIGDKKVGLNGAGVRQIIDAKYYVGGLYLREASTDQKAIMEADQPMAIRLEMVTYADQETMQRAFLNGLRGATNNNIEPIQDQIDQFMDCFSDSIKEGDVYEFRYMPEEGTKVYKSGEQLALIEGFDFKKAMFGIWLSDKPADKGLKEDMLAGDFRVAAEDIKGDEQEEKKVAQAPEEDREASQKKETPEEEAAGEGKAAEKEADIEKQKQKAAKKKAEAEKKTRKKEIAKAEASAGGEASAAGGRSDDTGREKEAKSRARAEQKDKEQEAEQAAEEEQKDERRAARQKQEAEREKTEEQKASAAKKAGSSVTRGEVTGEKIYFDTNDASLDEEAVSRLEKKAAWLEANPDASLSVEVFCDPRGSEEYNTWLAEQRGRSVRKWFKGRGIDGSRVSIEVRGAERLRGGGEKNWSKSRRAEFGIVE
ncbi:MAG: chalcone isomerase family protein [Desulfosalsimonas sp.]